MAQIKDLKLTDTLLTADETKSLVCTLESKTCSELAGKMDRNAAFASVGQLNVSGLTTQDATALTLRVQCNSSPSNHVAVYYNKLQVSTPDTIEEYTFGDGSSGTDVVRFADLDGAGGGGEDPTLPAELEKINNEISKLTTGISQLCKADVTLTGEVNSAASNISSLSSRVSALENGTGGITAGQGLSKSGNTIKLNQRTNHSGFEFSDGAVYINTSCPSHPAADARLDNVATDNRGKLVATPAEADRYGTVKMAPEGAFVEACDTAASGMAVASFVRCTLEEYYDKAEVDQIVRDANVDLSSYYTKGQVDAKLGERYTKTEVYNKVEVDNKIAGIAPTVDLSDYYTKSDTDATFATKEDLQKAATGDVDLTDYYKKSEADEKFISKDSEWPDHVHDACEVFLEGGQKLVDVLEDKQDKLTAGDNITISDEGVICATGGGGGSIEVDASLSHTSYNPVQNRWLGLRMGASAGNSVQIGFDAKAGSAINDTIDDGGDDGSQVAVGKCADGSKWGTAVGYDARGWDHGVAVGQLAIGSGSGVAIGYYTNGQNKGTAIGASASAPSNMVAIGYNATATKDTPIVIGTDEYAKAKITVSSEGILTIGGKAVEGSIVIDSSLSTSSTNPVQNKAVKSALDAKQDKLTAGTNITIGTDGTISATGGGSASVDTALSSESTNAVQNRWLGRRLGATSCNSVQIGYNAKAGGWSGNAVGGSPWEADDNAGLQVAVGREAAGTSRGAAVGAYANASTFSAAIGYCAIGVTYGVAVGYEAAGNLCGVAVGYQAKGASGNVAIGYCAVADETKSIAIGSGADVGGSSSIVIGQCAAGQAESVLIGQNTISSGTNSVTVGAKAGGAYRTVAIGYGAVASVDTPIVIGATKRSSADTVVQITVSSAGEMKVGGNAVAMQSALNALAARVAALEAKHT